ncbi:glycine/D-amino acid oxidase-like deaminating enzyme/nitrite reductase/ring-hydroxylating ferredoxin subunit [Pedobacter sp. CAN_A7]|uniref:FAD-dependent oxidoreductase n=1 Tax=Pedobacter sp. CAN_A7 TaxID=2787722 RepID=UPI0018CAA160
MKERDSKTISLWQNVDETDQLTPTINTAGITYDVLIVGGGISGLTTALRLQTAGKKCILAEARSIGFGTTGGTTAHLNTVYDTPYLDIEKDFGEEAAKLMALAAMESLSHIKNNIDQYGIDCDFEVKDAYMYSENKKETQQLADILAATRKAGINMVESPDNGVPVPFQLAALIKDQAQFHPLKYLSQLAKAFVDAGGVLLENTFIRKTSVADGLHTAESDHGNIQALNLVYATHMPPGVNLLDFRCAPYRSYVLGITLTNADYPDHLVYDMQEPYHYTRCHVIEGQKYLILGGEDHKTGHDDPEKAFKALEDYARKYYYVAEIPYRWSAQYYEPADGLPYIGQLPGADEHTFIATGFSGNGMIYGTLAANMITDHILGLENKYAKLLSPSRMKPVAGFTEFVKENADVAYRFIADRLKTQDIDSLAELAPGTGMVVKYQDEKLAIYKDQMGKVTALSPVCTHAGCIVNFNQTEGSWDCPCHGGRYDCYGKVITGPPTKDLAQIQLEE